MKIMDKNFKYTGKKLYCEQVSLLQLAHRHGTPLYVYSQKSIAEQLQKLKSAFAGTDALFCFSVKANPNLKILKNLFAMGCGADVVSGGELWRALKAGCDPKKIVFSGVGKTEAEIREGLKRKILQFNVESEGELLLIEKISKNMKTKAHVALRVNPDVDAKTHPYISTGLKQNKFGIDFKQAKCFYQKIKKSRWLTIRGVDCHIGSQITEIAPFEDAFSKLRDLVLELQFDGIAISSIDVGGGLGISYHNEPEVDVRDYARVIKKYFGECGAKIILEPGRFLTGHAGVLVTKVLYTKTNSFGKNFTVVDAGFNDFKRPMLYQAYHKIVPVQKNSRSVLKTDVVGPICETTDCFASDRDLPELKPGEYVAILDCGAYGASMASHYNSRSKPVEVLVSGKSEHVIRKRESLAEITRMESL